MMMGERGLYWKLTGRENLEYFGALYHLTPADRKRRAKEIIELLALEDLADRTVETYSSGQKMKLAFGKSLVNDAPLLILDEPTNTLDANSLEFGKLQLNQAAREAYFAGTLVELTSYEFDLLWMLAKHAGQTVRREAIHKQIIGREYDGLDRTVDVRVSHLRRKLGDNADTPFRIKTVWGKGYLFVADAWN